MNTLLGVAFSAGVVLYLAYAVRRYPEIAWPLAAGGTARLALAWIVGTEVFPVPGTLYDVQHFEALALQWSALPWHAIVIQFDPASSYTLALLGACLYKLLAPSTVMLSVLSVAAGIYVMVLTYRLALALGNQRSARVATWLVATFPFAILYSAMFGREVYGSVLFMLGLLACVYWARHNRMRYFVYACVCFICATPFHGAYALAILGLGVVAAGIAVRAVFRQRGKQDAGSLLAGVAGALIITVALSAAVAGHVTVNKLGDVSQLSLSQSIDQRVQRRVSDGRTSYPAALRGVNPSKRPAVLVGRIAYFLYSPFPWDIHKLFDLVGAYAGILFLLISLSLYRGRRALLMRRESLVVLVILVLLVCVFGISIDNIGTAIRHRTKLVYALLALCACRPFPKIRLSK